MLTQRLALLAAPLQKVVYDELFDAYRDAVIEKEIEDGSVDVFDWRAKTVDVSTAWGPDRDLSLMSAFDSPVYLHAIEYKENFQPILLPALLEQFQMEIRRAHV